MVHLNQWLCTPLILLHAATCLAACTRSTLQSTLDNLIQTAEKSPQASLKITSSTKITQNNNFISSMQQSKLTNFTGWGKPFHIDILDEEQCTTATLRAPKINNQLELFSSRIKITPTGEVLELELYHVGVGSHKLYEPQNLPNEANPMWSTDSPASHKSLVDATNTYPDAAMKGTGQYIPATSSCSRYENGRMMGVGVCNGGNRSMTFPVEYRRYYADTKTGVVLGNFLFSTLGNSTRKARGFKALWVHEYFKLDQGKIQQIVAAMSNVDDYWNDIWTTS
jgi:hypothetical protein